MYEAKRIIPAQELLYEDVVSIAQGATKTIGSFDLSQLSKAYHQFDQVAVEQRDLIGHVVGLYFIDAIFWSVDNNVEVKLLGAQANTPQFANLPGSPFIVPAPTGAIPTTVDSWTALQGYRVPSSMFQITAENLDAGATTFYASIIARAL